MTGTREVLTETPVTVPCHIFHHRSHRLHPRFHVERPVTKKKLTVFVVTKQVSLYVRHINRKKKSAIMFWDNKGYKVGTTARCKSWPPDGGTYSVVLNFWPYTGVNGFKRRPFYPRVGNSWSSLVGKLFVSPRRFGMLEKRNFLPRPVFFCNDDKFVLFNEGLFTEQVAVAVTL